jgi:hypothetical protein
MQPDSGPRNISQGYHALLGHPQEVIKRDQECPTRMVPHAAR